MKDKNIEPKPDVISGQKPRKRGYTQRQTYR